jgi:geranylgeranyl diphosphate synthase type II
VIGNEKELGKAVGTDTVKNTFVRLYGLEKCEELVNHYTDIALEALKVFPDHQYLYDLALQLTQRTS